MTTTATATVNRNRATATAKDATAMDNRNRATDPNSASMTIRGVTYSLTLDTVARNIRAIRTGATAPIVAIGCAWYDDVVATANSYSREFNLPLATIGGLFGALSIRIMWNRERELLATALSDYANGIAPLATATGVMGMVRGKVSALFAQQPTEWADVDRILSPDPKTLKTKSFARNCTGDLTVTTCDTWHWRAASEWADCPNRTGCAINRTTGAYIPSKHGCGDVPSGAAYNLIDAATRIVAAEFGEPTAVTQAIVWLVLNPKGAHAE